MVVQEKIREGLVEIKKYETTFYNPAQKTNRDISILIISEYFKNKENIRILDAMSATGLRGIRYIKEIKNASLFFNDLSTHAIECIKENLLINGVHEAEIDFFDNELSRIKNSCSLIKLINSDCNLLMNSLTGFFDVIDIDPFGGCSEYIESAFRSIKHNGILCFTCTDKGVFCSNEDKCMVKYSTFILKGYSMNEMALRTLLSCLSRHASKFGISIEPLASLSLDFYLRVFVVVKKNRPKNVVRDNSMYFLCKCSNFVEIKNNKIIDPKSEINISKEMADHLKLIEHEHLLADSYKRNSDTFYSNLCNTCGSNMKLCGPFWNREMHNRFFIDNLVKNFEIKDDRITGIFNYLLQEIDDPFYFEMPVLCSRLKLNCIRNKDIMNGLSNLGYKVSFTHCDVKGIKTNASVQILDSLILIKNKKKDDLIFTENEFIKKLFTIPLHKGSLSSCLGPLSLPKNFTKTNK